MIITEGGITMKIYEVREVDKLIGANDDHEYSVALCTTLEKAREAARDAALVTCYDINKLYVEGNNACRAEWSASPAYGEAATYVLDTATEDEDVIEEFVYVISERELI